MNWDAIGAVAETLGTIGVIASLVYVAVQVRQNSRLIDHNILMNSSTMIHDTAVSYVRFFELLAENPDLADIYRRGINAEKLEKSEVVRFESLLEIYTSWLEDVDHQYNSDLYFDEADKTDLIEWMYPVYKQFLSSPIARDWWARRAKHTYTINFYSKMSQLMRKWDADNA